MQVLLNIKIDPRMKAALKTMAEQQFISVSAAVKQAIEKHLLDQGVDWRRGGESGPLDPGDAPAREPARVSVPRAEPSFYSVEIPSGDNLIHQFNIQEETAEGVRTILIREGSQLLRELKTGDELDLKYYGVNPLRPVEMKHTEVLGISKDVDARFKGHYAVTLRAAEETS
jgi:hypothetical protein